MSFSVTPCKLDFFCGYGKVTPESERRQEGAEYAQNTVSVGGDMVNFSQNARNAASAKPSKEDKLAKLAYTPVQSMVTKNGEKVSVEAAWDMQGKNCLGVKITIVRADGSSETLYRDDTTILSPGSDGKLNITSGLSDIALGDTDDIVIALPAKDGSYKSSINAGDGNNTIIDFSGGSSTIITGNGNDLIIGRGGDFAIDAGGGNDVVMVQGERVSVSGGSGDDTITVTAKEVDIDGGAGRDTIKVNGAESGTVRGGDGDDYIEIAESSNLTIDGGDGDDIIRVKGVLADSTISGGKGNDTIRADELRGSTVNGGDGNDEITVGNAKNTLINGGLGDDVITVGHATGGSIRGGGGQDSLTVNGQRESLAEGQEEPESADEFLAELNSDTLAGAEARKSAARATGRSEGLTAYFHSNRDAQYSRSIRRV